MTYSPYSGFVKRMNNSGNENMTEAQKRLAKFSRKQSETFAQSNQYSNIVRKLRLILPMVAIAIIAALLTWPTQERNIAILQEEQQESLQNIRKNELSAPRFESVDEKNQPYTLTADLAVQKSDDENVMLLTKPLGDLLLNSGSWIAIKAEDGTYWKDEEKLLLTKNVRLFHDEGYEMTMAELHIDLKTHTAKSETPIKGQGPAGSIEASGLNGDNANGILTFTGPAKLILKDAGSLNSLSKTEQKDG